VLLDCLHFGMRMMRQKSAPICLRPMCSRSWMRCTRPSWRQAWKTQKEAIDAARRRADQEMKEGRYRSLRQFPMLWDTRDDTLYVGATQPAVIERWYHYSAKRSIAGLSH